MEEKTIDKTLEDDILFNIDMQLYDEFNDKIATMRDYIGDIYSLRDIEEVEQAQKEREIELLRKAIITQQKEIEELVQINEEHRILNGKLREEIKGLKKEKEDILDFIED
jgi:hypothetical protein